MDKSVPAPAAILLDFISKPESGGGYTVIYGNHQSSLTIPITSWSLNSLMANQAVWGSKWSSSAAGRYQIMPQTLKGLIAALHLTGNELFDPDMQDRLAFQLLVQRGYYQFITGYTSVIDFGKQIAEEWASFPVLAPTQGAHRMLIRGQSYYSGDGLNNALVKPEAVEAVFAQMLATKTSQIPPAPPKPTPAPSPSPIPKPAPRGSGLVYGRFLLNANGD